MKTRSKVLIVLLLAGLYFVLVQHFGAHCPSNKYLPHDLDRVYASNNSEYFSDKLPKDVVIDWSEKEEESMAVTEVDYGRFHIKLNPFYVRADRTAWLVLLHEQCHIETWDEALKGEEHGHKWQLCMLRLEMSGAYRPILIDGVSGRK